MSRLAVLIHPDRRLRTVAASVTRFDDALARLIDDLFETLAGSGAIGLAATQVDVHVRVLVTDVPDSGPMAYVNPQILTRELPAISEESCLSLPGLVGRVPRSGLISVQARDRDGALFTRELTGLDAVCVQHEMDHLHGVLFADHLPWLQRLRLRRKLAGAAG